VGKLYQDKRNDPYNSNNLTFKEACNKINHNQHINYDSQNPKNIQEYDSINKTIYLDGDYNDKEWKVELDVCEFLCVLIDIK
jgi:hypothetical protein